MISTTVMSFSNTHGIMGEVDIAVIALEGSVMEVEKAELVVPTEECTLCQYDNVWNLQRKTYIWAC